RDFAIEVFGLELTDPFDGLAVNPLETWCELFDRARTLDVRRCGVHREPTSLETISHIGIPLGEMPGQLTKGPSAGVRAEIVLCWRQCFEKFDGVCGLTSQVVRNISSSFMAMEPPLVSVPFYLLHNT